MLHKVSTSVLLHTNTLTIFQLVPDISIVLWLTPDDFTCEGETSQIGKGEPVAHPRGRT